MLKDSTITNSTNHEMQTNVSDYNVQLEPWYSPGITFKAYNYITKLYTSDELTDNLFKRAHEMFHAALTITGALALHSTNQYIMQSNNQSDTPDVFVAIQDPIDLDKTALGLHRFELVEFTSHTETDDLIKFLYDTKLSSKKSYTKDDWIVIALNKFVTLNINETIKKLSELKPLPKIYAVGRFSDAPPGMFQIHSLYPNIHMPVKFHIYKTLEKYTEPDAQMFFRGKNNPSISSEKERVTVDYYELLGVNRKKVLKKFGIRTFV